ncbi:acetyl-CoA carboxylase carboxyl transferase subunit beta [Spinactinospora alkalitolerans]|uniref:Multifunctional fusion protein n=1 Tax=Spinactinospora alkalitolerans TaxID=687207 RepID=A0A852TQ51_9ACTN|nr:acetyl-CoA carboxylase, carboxyltransferase subunit beta [Spinactinospora alkalitolerans]NYE45407.1 acetyl-CoA carboxylase carboxyl transferase subunit beta [Spinactinospora alkalitolerans]
MTIATTRSAATSEWTQCKKCRTLVYTRRLLRAHRVCPECGNHAPLTAEQRLGDLFGDASWTEVAAAETEEDPLGFVDLHPYRERLAEARARTGLRDAVVVARGEMYGGRVVVAVMDFRFLGGSMGASAGEAVVAAAEAALAERCPLILVTASGGARMQEGLLSLMQMAKTSNAMAALDEAGLLTVTLVTDPTYGGVAASFATQSDVILAEPGARLGFAGPRVIEQTIRQRLPEGFQTAEFLLAHGLLDDVRSRAGQPHTLSVLLAAARPVDPEWGIGTADPVIRDPASLPRRPVREVIRSAREPARPTATDHLDIWGARFVELHGDRAGRDCPAVLGGVALLGGLPFVFIAHHKGHTPAEMARREFAMPSPAGYRKAERLMRLADKLGLPVVTLIDTPGAHPGIDAEEHGQANAVASCLRTMGALKVPVVAVVTGEGGSGGALALGVADEVLACENAFYSVISPEGCAAILWKSTDAVEEAAESLRIDAPSLLRIGAVDGVVPEPPGGAHKDPEAASANVRDAVTAALRRLRGRSAADLVSARRRRFRRFGLVHDSEGTTV